MNTNLWILLVVAIAIIAIAVLVVINRSRDRGPSSLPGVEAPERGLRSKLSRTREAIGGRLGDLLGSSTLDGSFWSELEEALIAADVGVATATVVVDDVRKQNPNDGDTARRLLEESLIGQMSGRDRSLHLEGKPAVILVVGVNGTGKTTSIAKIAGLLGEGGRTALLGAADTFRAAADEQLRAWAGRVGVEVVSGAPGSDPAAVAYDAYGTAVHSGIDVVLVDTAGRLHSKTNLMDELGKVARVLRREAGQIGEILLVLDGTTGQNAIGQARSFTGAVGVTGIVLTKLDGTSRGGVAIAVEQELDIPVKYIGVGEGLHDLVPFEPRAFIEALLEP
ncbi:MAG: signal recognition particle-docking protein FtsY [Actinomycetota bacterium]|nr:signal recognition particle-docking protein FtsY [Actinomycetota bacterium]